MDRRKPNRPPLLLLPLVIMLLITVGVWMAINVRRATQTISLQAIEFRQQFVADRVRYAVNVLKKGESDSARKAIEDAIQVRGGTSDAVVAVAEELIYRDQPVFAAEVLRKASEQSVLNWDPMLWATLAKAQEHAGNHEAAQPALAEADRRAEAVLQEIGKQTPVQENRPTPQQLDAVLRFIQVGLYYSDVHRNPEAAFRALRAAQAIWPESTMVQNALGYTLVDIGVTPQDIDEGLVLTQRAANAEPDSGMVRDSYGWALYRKGDMVGARRVLREAVDMEPDIPEIHYHLGMVYAKLDLIPQAAIELGRALDLRPDYPDAAKAMALVKTAASTPPPPTDTDL